jgi:hypothetical protein
MTTQHVTILLPPYGTATLRLPQVLTPDAFARLDSAIADALREARPDRATGAADDPGAIEFDSWSPQQH